MKKAEAELQKAKEAPKPPLKPEEKPIALAPITHDVVNHFDSTVYHQSVMNKAINAVNKANSKIAFSNIYNTNKYKYIVTAGNNSKLIKEAMKRRSWWVEIPNVDTVFNFKWQPTSYRMKFRDLVYKHPANKQIVNHVEFHKYLSEKSELFSCFQNYCENIKANVFDVMPIQFFVQVNMKMPNATNNAISQFASFFNLIEESKSVLEGITKTSNLHQDYIIDESILNINLYKSHQWIPKSKDNGSGTKFKLFNFQKRGTSYHTRFEMPISHCAGHNFWILKATNLNRGRGIHVFNDLETLKSLIEDY